MNHISLLREIWFSGVDAVLPHRAVYSAVKRFGNTLSVFGKLFTINNNCYIVGFGKAVLGMVRPLEEMLGADLRCGIVSVPFGSKDSFIKSNCAALLPGDNSRVTVMEGAVNNLPDTDALNASTKIYNLVSPLTQTDVLIVLVSGGGSALLPAPPPFISLEEKGKLVKQLSEAGATIHELNCVRKHLSTLKGGGLAGLAYPAKVISLILSDIIGDRLDLIASGPTVCNMEPVSDSIRILKRYNAFNDLPPSITNHLDSLLNNPNSQQNFDHTHNFLIGSSRTALSRCKEMAEDKSIPTFLLSTTVSGDATKTALLFSKLCLLLCKRWIDNDCLEELTDFEQHGITREQVNSLFAWLSNLKTSSDKLIIMSGGETVVKVVGGGKGGRNQEFSLAVGMYLDELFVGIREMFDVCILSGGTDGIDGPTDAAGAFTYLDQVKEAKSSGINPQLFLQNNDSYEFYRRFREGCCHLKPGHTGTNVMDIQLALITKK